MYYVYLRHVKSGKEQFARCSFEKQEDAIEYIARCYKTDEELGVLGEFYYFLKEG